MGSGNLDTLTYFNFRLFYHFFSSFFFRIDAHFVIKVADFGLSESLNTSKEYFRQDQDCAIKLPIKWMAPESMNDGKFSEKSDMVINY